MKTTVKDAMTIPVVAVRRDATFREMSAALRRVRHVRGVVAVRDRLSYPDEYPLIAGPIF